MGIRYNSLNLPTELAIKNINASGKTYYTYSASGVKLRTEHKSSDNLNYTPVMGTSGDNNFNETKVTDYAGNIIYEDDGLKRILVGGGYIENGKYHYYLKDHLGNNRVVIDQYNDQIQSSQYYPFGMTFAESTGQTTQPYKYNGKELDKTHGLNWYDYSARHYEPAIGRFTTVDPHAESYYSWSPYAYCYNNPLKFIDPDGKDGRLTGNGTEEDPYVIEAIYFYQEESLAQEQIDGLNAAINAYNSKGTVKIKDNNGSKVFVRYNLSSREVSDVQEARRGTAFETTNGEFRYYGNIVGTEPSTGEEYGSANNNSIHFNLNNIAIGITNGMDAEELNKGIMIHEIGHNLGGQHSHGTSVMRDLDGFSTGGGFTNQPVRINYIYPKMDNKFTGKIFRIRDSRKDDPNDGRIWTQRPQ